MVDSKQPWGTFFRRMSFSFLLLLMVTFSFEVPVDVGWSKGLRILPLVTGELVWLW